MKFTASIYSGLARITSVAAGVCIIFLSSCGGNGGEEPEPTPPTAGETVLINLVASPWKIISVTVDGTDKSNLFTNFSLTFVSSSSSNGKPTSFSGTFTTTNGGTVWPSSGNWNLNDIAVGSKLTRNDGLEIQLTEVTESSLKMSLGWNKTTIGPGRISSVKGQHIFSMGK